MSSADSSLTPAESIKPSKRSRPQGDRATISMHHIAERFRRAREEAGLTLREVAERAELAPSTIQKIENQRIVPWPSRWAEAGMIYDRAPQPSGPQRKELGVAAA